METTDYDMNVTFIMPAYNVDKYISRAIDSIIAQTRTDWKLIIVNDASTDKTFEIIKEYASRDNRIKYYSLPYRQGNAYNVRKVAIEIADTIFVSPLDADDWIEPMYLDKLIKRQKESNADIVYPAMINPNNNETIVPVDKFDISNVSPGKDFIINTLNGWEIGANGGVIRRSLYLNLFSENFRTNYITSDEYLTRRLLFEARNVAFSDARYFYFYNSSSITHLPTSRIFDILTSDFQLSVFLNSHYKKTSPEYINLQLQRFFHIIDSLRHLNQYSRQLTPYGKKKGYLMIKQAYNTIDWKTVHNNIGWKYYYLMKSGIWNASYFLKIYDKFFPGKY